MNKVLFAAITALFFMSCSNDDDTPPEYVPAAFEKGILVTNEGPFGNGSGNITFISEDFSTVTQNIYRTVNGTELGNIVQSMGFQDDNAYIVVNNSNKIMIANRYSFEAVDPIKSGVNNPRDTADDFVAVLDLRNNTVSSTIPVSFGPERMVSYNNKIYVAHQGGFGQNNLISVISGNTLESTITVGDAPNSMVIAGNSLFVLCGGNPNYTGNETAGSLVEINLSNNEILNTYTFGTVEHPSSLTMDGSNLFYSLDGKVYSLNVASISLPGNDIVDGFFYALEAKDGMLYATDADDFASRGSLLIYDLSTNQQVQNFQTGIVPGGIYFNE